MSEIAVSIKRLSEIAGVEVTEAMLPTWQHRLAARALTDGVGKGSAAISNALCWIQDAYEAGKREGIEVERLRWESRISSLFGMRVK